MVGCLVVLVGVVVNVNVANVVVVVLGIDVAIRVVVEVVVVVDDVVGGFGGRGFERLGVDASLLMALV